MNTKQYVFRHLCFGLVILALVFMSVSCNPGASALEQTPSVTGEVPVLPVVETFYGVGPLLNDELQQIALADPAVQALLEGQENTFIVDGHEVVNKNYQLSVGARLRDAVTSEQFNAWMDSGREDSDLIDEYVGVLNIGYNVKYDIVFDMESGTVSALVLQSGFPANIPEITAAEKERALQIAMDDPVLRQILEGKSYRLAPDNKIGVWHTGETKLGVAFEISFDVVYSIDADLPRYQNDLTHFSGEVERLLVNVLFEENRVVSIIPISPLNVD